MAGTQMQSIPRAYTVSTIVLLLRTARRSVHHQLSSDMVKYSLLSHECFKASRRRQLIGASQAPNYRRNITIFVLNRKLAKQNITIRISIPEHTGRCLSAFQLFDKQKQRRPLHLELYSDPSPEQQDRIKVNRIYKCDVDSCDASHGVRALGHAKGLSSQGPKPTAEVDIPKQHTQDFPNNLIYNFNIQHTRRRNTPSLEFQPILLPGINTLYISSTLLCYISKTVRTVYTRSSVCFLQGD